MTLIAASKGVVVTLVSWEIFESAMISLLFSYTLRGRLSSILRLIPSATTAHKRDAF